MNKLMMVALPALLIACGSKDDTGDTGTTDATATGTGTGATGTGTGATGTGTGATGTGTGATGTGAPYDITLTGSGYTPHDGQTMWASVWTYPDYTQVGSTQTWTQSGDTINVVFAGANAGDGTEYNVYWGADFDGSGDCDMAYDHAWSVAIGAPMADETLVEDHDTDFDPYACGLF